MLPSSGYFQSVYCPFYNNGLCERPHCHFRHAKKDVCGKTSYGCSIDESLIKSGNEDGKKTDFLHIVDAAIQQVQQDVEIQKAALEAVGYSNLETVDSYNKIGHATYIPTPMSKCSLQILPSSYSSKPHTEPKLQQKQSIPQYHPTPISQLKKLQKLSEKEYDPVNNFTTPVQPVKRKKHSEYSVSETKYVMNNKELSGNKESYVPKKMKIVKKESETLNKVEKETCDFSETDNDWDITAEFSDDESDDEAAVSLDINRTDCVNKCDNNLQNKYDVDTTKCGNITQSEPLPVLTVINEFDLVDMILMESKKTQDTITDKSTIKKVHKSKNDEREDRLEKVDKKNSVELETNNKDIDKESKLFTKNRSDINNISDKKEIIEKEAKLLTKNKSDKKEIEKESKLLTKNKSDIDGKSDKKEIDKDSKLLIKNKSDANSKSDKKEIDKESKLLIRNKSDRKDISNNKNDKKFDAIKNNKLSKSNEINDKKSKNEAKSSKTPKSSEKTETNLINNKCDKPIETKDDKSSKHKEIKHHQPLKFDEAKDGKLVKVKTVKSSETVEKKSFKANDKKDHKSIKSDERKHRIDKINSQKSESVSKLHKSSKANKPIDDGIKKKNKIEKVEAKNSTKVSSELANKKFSKSEKHLNSEIVSKLKKDKIKEKLKNNDETSKSEVCNKFTDNMKSSKHIEKSKVKEKHETEQIVTKHSNSSKNSEDRKKHKLNGKKSEKKGDLKIEEINTDSKIEANNFQSDSDSDQSVIIDLDSDLDEHDTYEECLRIFNEEITVEKHDNSNIAKAQRLQELKAKENEINVLGKKRVAHQSNITRTVPYPNVVAPRITPGQILHNRYAKVQEMYQTPVKNDGKKPSSAFLNQLNLTDSGRKRIAHVPNASLLAAAALKQKLLNQTVNASTSSSTTATTVTKGERRIAHIPTNVKSKRPIIPAEYGSKVPCNVRQRYLEKFIDECLKFCESEELAYQTALEEERNAYNRSANKTVYLNVAINTLKRLRNKMPVIVECDGSSDSEAKRQKLAANNPTKTISHQFVLGGPKAAKTSYSIEKRKVPKIEDNIKGPKLFKSLSSYMLTEQQLEENGFPRPHPTENGKAVIFNMQKKPTSNNPLERTCCRCQTRYRVTSKGKYVKQEECIYHWGRLWKRRIAGAMDSRYSCCQGDSQSEGCCVAQGHVHEDYDVDNLRGYVKTLTKSPRFDGDYGVYALDCEMCYTTAGIELTRITVIGSNLEPIYETLVLPDNPVLDFNTRFSGITEDDLNGVTTSLEDVQAVLLSLCNSQTILIGHSLESDFKALKLIHDTVVDTSVVFPHKMGPPYKRALRTLMAEYLNKIIQNSVDGHDSQEDAISCMELMLWKIKEDARKSFR